MVDPQLPEIIAAWGNVEHDPTARAAAVRDTVAWSLAAADRKRAYEEPLRRAWLLACLVPGLPPTDIDDGQFSYTVRDLARRPLVAEVVAAIPESLPILPGAERSQPADADRPSARLREYLLVDGTVSLDVSLAEFTPDGAPDLSSEGRLVPTWHLSWPEESTWTHGVDWNDFDAWTGGILEAEAGVLYAEAGDTGWFRLGLDSPRPADDVLALFLRAGLAAYRRAANVLGIDCP
ncbi:hypothetical protein [Micromonospora sp. C28ISP2-4]|uniref:hypothetical protein n=1 Tax=Micromonospora sp. C28ISP2-4 TaxID=3059523 RepID=UPI0026746271|nr:hypothetical protein [Micromonospora sp. C28ISP2-4]MDO3682466.1 hypothetical protein [Micromonospora sp. C28ISP2-4]